MRTMMRNKQKMYYCNQVGVRDVYETDADGNIEYVTVDGEQVPISAEERVPLYGEPVPFSANINARLHDAIMRAFGADNSKNYAQVVTAKNEFDWKIGTRIWMQTEVKRTSDGYVDYESADYVVMGVLDESLNEDAYYLQKLNGASE